MKKTVFICDRCRVDMEGEPSAFWESITRRFNNKFSSEKSYLFCIDCAEAVRAELDKIIARVPCDCSYVYGKETHHCVRAHGHDDPHRGQDFMHWKSQEAADFVAAGEALVRTGLQGSESAVVAAIRRVAPEIISSLPEKEG